MIRLYDNYHVIKMILIYGNDKKTKHAAPCKKLHLRFCVQVNNEIDVKFCTITRYYLCCYWMTLKYVKAKRVFFFRNKKVHKMMVCD